MIGSTTTRQPRVARLLLRRRFLLVGSAFLLLSFAGNPAAVALQAAPASAPANLAPLADTIGPLRAALTQAGAALNQIRIDRWKVSREWKGQLSNDASSIQQDLANSLPALFQAAEQSPGVLEPQMKLMQNIDALYDVMVRVTTAANLSGGKMDAAVLDSALQNLESARKASAAQLLQTAVQQDRRIDDFRAQLRNARAEHPTPVETGKTIIVDNQVTHRHKRRPVRHQKKAAPKNAPPTTPPVGNTSGANGSHSNIP